MLKGTKPKGTKLKGTNLKKRQSLKIENSCCLLQPNNKINKSLPTYLMIYLLLYQSVKFTCSQCARTDLNKRFLPKPMTTTG